MFGKERFVNLRFFTFMLLCVILGIVVGYVAFFKDRLLSTIFILFVLVAYFIILFFIIKYSKKLSYLIFMIIAVIILVTAFLSTFFKLKSFTSENIDEGRYTIKGTVKEINENGLGKEVVLKDLVFVCDKDFTSDYNLQVILSDDCEVDLGNRISITADVFHNTVVYENEPRMDVINNKIRFTASNVDYGEYKILDNKVTLFGKTYNAIRDTLKERLSGDRYGVALALITGNSQKISSRTLNSFRFAGVAHIFAVSGLHIGVFATALGFIFKLFPKSKRKYFSPIIVALLTFYSGVCGFSSSSIRAVIMYSVLIISSLFDERYDGISSLSLSAFFTLTFMPFELFQAGFLLSYSASFFIVALIHIFTKKLSFLPRWLSSSLAVGLSAFLAGLPISLKYFGYISPIALLLNVIFLPIISILFVLLIASVFVSLIIGHAKTILIPANFLLTIINKAFIFFRFDNLIVSYTSMGIFAIFYYFALLLTAGIFNFKKKIKTLIICLCFSISFGGAVYRNNLYQNAVYVTTSSSYSTNVTLMRYKDDSVLILSDAVELSTKGISRAIDTFFLTSIDALIIANSDVNIIEISKDLQKIVNIEEIYCYDTENKIEVAYGVPVRYLQSYEDVMVKSIKFRFIADGYTVESFCQKTHVVTHSHIQESSVGYYLADGNPSLIVAQNNIYEFEKLYKQNVESFSDSNTHTFGNDNYIFNLNGKLIH